MMLTPILTPKLSVPPLRHNLVDRKRLVNRLNQGAGNGFVLISAPAGYGKTTLVSAWLSQLGHAYAWLSLDRSDNDISRFLTYLGAALSRLHGACGRALREPGVQNLHRQIGLFLTPLINQLSQAQQDLFLVLDDYHVIQNQAVHEAVRFLLDNRPESFHLVIATRTDPPFPLSRMRARSQILELREADLRFSRPEAEEFLTKVMGVALSDKDLAVLDTSTEGWIAGLQMAGLSLQKKENVSHYIQSFAGKNRYILDFLFDEIFQRQTEEIQHFLLHTAFLNRLCGSLCDCVAMRADSKAVLDTLEHSNLFLIALDDEREWYRYHNLFQLLLQQLAKNKHADTLPAMHRRASEWYEINENSSEAIAHAIAAQDFDHAARLIEENADKTLLKGEVNTFLSRVEKLPADVLRQRPLLCVYHAEALLLSGQPIDRIESPPEGSPEHEVIRALNATYQGNLALSKRLSAQAMEHLPVESLFLRGFITSSLGAMLVLSGDVGPAIEVFQKSAAISHQSKHLMFEVIALCRLAQLFLMSGEIQKAENLSRQALALSDRGTERYFPVASMPLMTLASLKYEVNDLKSAGHLIQQAVELCTESGGFWAIDCYLVYAFVLQAQGSAERAQESMQRARSIAVQTVANPFDDTYSAIYEAQLNLMQGNLAAAEGWARGTRGAPGIETGTESRNARFNADLFHLEELAQLTLARVFLAQGDADNVLDLLLPLFPETEKRGRALSLVENLILQALANQCKGLTKEALKNLAGALVLAEATGFIRVFLNEGAPLHDLLKIFAAQEKDQGAHDTGQPAYLNRYAQQLIAAFSNEPGFSAPGHIGRGAVRTGLPGDQIIEPLTRREREVMDQLARGLSNKEIARNLFIAPGTVHKHLKNIYSKLDVHHRAAAIARAHELGLL